MSHPGRTPARPRLHFTADRGWINDPHGICFVDGRYHLFTQYNPARAAWSPAIHWGHATSLDLHRWSEQPAALRPEDGEVGCWTGDLALGPDGPVIFYTSVVGEGPELDAGRIAVAAGSASLDAWSRAEDPVVIGGPPSDGEPVLMFRDPQLRRESDGWRMIVGARFATSGGAVLQYRSDDLKTWADDGVLADHSSLVASMQSMSIMADGVRLGTMWECPQFFALDGSWVLLFSSWEDQQLLHVVAAIGDYDGRRFTARSLQRFGHGDVVYATTTFEDADGRRCAMSWLRESVESVDATSVDGGAVRAGAISLPCRLAIDGNRLVASFHPDLDTACGHWRGVPGLIDGRPEQVAEPYVRLQMAADVGVLGTLTVSLVQSGREPMTITVDGPRRLVEIRGADGRQAGLARLFGDRAGEGLDVVLDGDTLEVLVAGMDGVLAARTPFRADVPVVVETSTTDGAQLFEARVAAIAS